LPLVAIKTDHRREFDKDKFIDYSNKNAIFDNILAPRIPQQNRAVHRKNQTLEDMARTLIRKNDSPRFLSIESVNSINYVCNK